MCQLSGDVAASDVDGYVGGRVATNGDAAQGTWLVLRVDEIVGEELRQLAATELRLVLVQQYNADDWSCTTTNTNIATRDENILNKTSPNVLLF